MRLTKLPYVLLLSTDIHWHRTVAGALEGVAQVKRMDSPDQVELWWAEEQEPTAPVLVDTALMSDPDELRELVYDWSKQSLVVVTYSVPSWRDAVELLQAGAIDYVRKIDNVTQTRSHLDAFMKAIATRAGGGPNDQES